MKRQVRFPIRLKIMITLLFGITAVVSVITFTMANFFHSDKSAYIKDWVSIAAVSTAEEARSMLLGYTERLETSSLIMLSEKMDAAERQVLLQHLFDSLPELIEVAIYQDGETLEVVSDTNLLEQAGLSAEDVRAHAEAHPLPVEAIVAGEVHVRSSSISDQIPSFVLAFPLALEDDEKPFIVSALLRLDGLLGLGSKFKVFEIIIADADGTLLAHPDVKRVLRNEPSGLTANAEAVHRNYRTGMTIEYVHEDREMLGGFADAEFGVTVISQMPRAAAYLASRELLERLLMVAIGLLVAVAVIGRLWSRRITRPMERLSEATRSIAKGEFDVEVDVVARDEIGALAGSFNQMASELKTRDEKLHDAQALLVQSEKMAAFGQLGAGIAHEVKNPLAGILGCAQLSLMEIEKGSPLEENLKIIEKETARCRTIIDNLMRFARQEKTVLEPTEVNHIVDDAINIVNHQLELNQVKIIRDLDASLPMVQGNANQLQQVLMNLMMNAQQAMEGQPGSVTVHTRSMDHHVEIVVSDDGPGIPKDLQKKLFEPFFTTKPTGKGTGLGLSVSFGIIKDHQGEILVESEPGKGTDFIIHLPIFG